MSETTSDIKEEIPGWWVKLLTAVMEQLPRPGSGSGQIDKTKAEFWTKNQASLRNILAGSLLTPTAAVQVKRLKSTLLNPFGTVKISATTTLFVAKDHFVEKMNDDVQVKIWSIWDKFKTRFLQGDGKVERPIYDTELRYHRLKKRLVDTPILEELGGVNKSMTTLTEVFILMTKQARGEKGDLLVNGDPNIFYVETEVILPVEEHLAYTNYEDKKVVLCAVPVSWSTKENGWEVGAYSVLHSSHWDIGAQVVSRNFVLESSGPSAPTQG